MPPDTTESLGKRDVVVYKSADDHPSGHKLMSIESIHPMYDPLMYVLMFPFGDKGFSPDAHPLTKKTFRILLCYAVLQVQTDASQWRNF